MAVRRPLFYDGSDFKEMTAAMVTAIQDRCVYVYGGSPSVTIEISVGSGSLDTNTTASNCTALGFNALTACTSGGSNTATAKVQNNLLTTLSQQVNAIKKRVLVTR